MRLALAAWMLAWAATASGWTLDLAGYQQADGAITIERDGDQVDPYFALKALFVAHECGADIALPLRRFVAWLLPRTAADGRIGRYARLPDGRWRATRRADADDVALALWIEALLASAAGRPLAAREQHALARSERYLEQVLFDPALGVYRVYATDDDPLFMDNVEVLAALRAVEALERQRGDAAAARRWRGRSERLATAIEHVFAGVDTLAPQPTAGGRRTVAAGAAGEPDPEPFYPAAVTAPFAWLHGVPRHRVAARFDAWLARNGQAWRDYAQHDYSWGLIALVASREGRPDVAAQWRRDQDQQRSAGLWNVLEESAWQALAQVPATAPARHG